MSGLSDGYGGNRTENPGRGVTIGQVEGTPQTPVSRAIPALTGLVASSPQM